MSVMDLLQFIVFNAVQFLKAWSWIVVTVSGKVISVKLVQPSNVDDIIFTRLLGNFTDERLVQPANALPLISSILLYILTFSNDVQSLKAFSPIVVTVSGMSIFSNP